MNGEGPSLESLGQPKKPIFYAIVTEGVCNIGKVKSLIKHCALLDPDTGYKKAEEILFKNFSRKNVIAHLDKYHIFGKMSSYQAGGLQ